MEFHYLLFHFCVFPENSQRQLDLSTMHENSLNPTCSKEKIVQHFFPNMKKNNPGHLTLI